MAAEEQKKKIWELAMASQAILNEQVAIIGSITPELYETNPDEVDVRLDQVKALTVKFDAARKECNDYRERVLKGTEE